MRSHGRRFALPVITAYPLPWMMDLSTRGMVHLSWSFTVRNTTKINTFTFSLSILLFTSDVKWNGYLRLNLVNGHLNLREFYSTLLLKSVKSHFEGISGDPELDKFYNELIERTLPGALRSRKQRVSRYITKNVMGRANKVLNKIRLVDLLHG